MLYKLLCGAARFVLKPRVRFEGREYLPLQDAAVIIANHRHAFDPIVMGMALKRPVHFLSKKELSQKKITKWFFDKMLCIPIDRENMDRTALREAVAVLKDGGVLGVFPEGTRSATGRMLPFKSGACYISSQAPCSIVPMAIEGSDRLFRFFSPKVTVRIGEPFRYEALEGERRKQTLERMTQKQEDAVRALLEMS